MGTEQPKLGSSALRAEHDRDYYKRKKRKAKTKAKKREREHRRENSQVYAIEMGPFLKVGFTRESVANRLTSLQTGSPIPLKLVGSWPHRQPHRLEAFVHSLLADCRMSGEWFLCSIEDVEAAVAAASELPRSATWADWNKCAIAAGGDRIADDWKARRASSDAATRAARRSHSEIVEAFAAWFESQTVEDS